MLVVAMLTGSVATAPAETATVAVKDIRLGVTAERTRLVLDLGAKVDFDIFLLDRPRRVVVDLP